MRGLRNKGKNNSVYTLCVSALIAAIYVVLTVISAMLGLDKGIIQFRISEALCILAVFTPAAIPGLTVGCLLSDFLCGAVLYDIIFGTLATFLGVLGTRVLRKIPYLAPLPYVVSNTVIIPIVLAYVYEVQTAFHILLITVGIGELVCAYIGGIILYRFLKKIEK